MFLEFPSTKEGYGDIIQLGDGSSAQTDLAQVPYEIVLDRVYIHGDPIYGQKRGIALNARTVTIRNSYISDIKAVGVDTQAIGGWNGPGPFSIENNYLEASGEVVLLGGSDPAIPEPRQRGRVGPLQPHDAADGVARCRSSRRRPSVIGRRRRTGVARRPASTRIASPRAVRLGAASSATSAAVRRSHRGRQQRRGHVSWDAVAGRDRIPGLRARRRRASTQYWTVTGRRSFTTARRRDGRARRPPPARAGRSRTSSS